VFGFEGVECVHMAEHQWQWWFFFKRDTESILLALLITVVDKALLSKDSGLLGCDHVAGTKRLSTFRWNTPPISRSMKKA
jgi:hypothetical protein